MGLTQSRGGLCDSLHRGVKDHALPPGNLTGFDRYFTDLRFRLFTEGDHNVSQLKYREVNAEIREFLQGGNVPRVKVIGDITS